MLFSRVFLGFLNASHILVSYSAETDEENHSYDHMLYSGCGSAVYFLELWLVTPDAPLKLVSIIQITCDYC